MTIKANTLKITQKLKQILVVLILDNSKSSKSPCPANTGQKNAIRCNTREKASKKRKVALSAPGRPQKTLLSIGGLLQVDGEEDDPGFATGTLYQPAPTPPPMIRLLASDCVRNAIYI